MFRPKQASRKRPASRILECQSGEMQESSLAVAGHAAVSRVRMLARSKLPGELPRICEATLFSLARAAG